MSKTDINELELNGVKYVRKDSISSQPEPSVDGMDYCIVRTYSAGVFAGYLKSLDGMTGVVLKARRLWQWSGAASLSQLSVDGVDSENSKFPCEVPIVTLTQVIEVLVATKKAKKSIDSVKIWEI